MNWKNNFKKGKQIILATSSSKSIPNANIVISLGFVDNKILVADCQMKNTIRNLRQNPNISAVGGYFRINGTAKIFSSGKYFDLCAKDEGEYIVKNAILITPKQVFNLDKVRIVK
jgi:hypothetical protein